MYNKPLSFLTPTIQNPTQLRGQILQFVQDNVVLILELIVMGVVLVLVLLLLPIIGGGADATAYAV